MVKIVVYFVFPKVEFLKVQTNFKYSLSIATRYIVLALKSDENCDSGPRTYTGMSSEVARGVYWW